MENVERQLKLVALLRDTGRPLTFEEIGDQIGAYRQDEVAAKRMFERDKDDLREIGVPIERAPTDVWGVDEGYIIRDEAYELPEIPFTDEELSALLILASLPDESDAAQGVRKLLAGSSKSPLSRRVPPVAAGQGEEIVADLAIALAERRIVRFGYRTSAGREAERRVDPWGLVAWGGRWYLVGRDRDRNEIRAFRVTRIQTEVITEAQTAEPPPPGFSARDHLSGPWEDAEAERMVMIAVSERIAWLVRQSLPDATEVGPHPDGRVRLSVPHSRVVEDRLLGFGSEVEVLEPKEVRRAVADRLRQILETV